MSADVNNNGWSLKGSCHWEFRGGAIQIAEYEQAYGSTAGGLLFKLLNHSGLAQVVAFNPATFDANLTKMSLAGSEASVDQPNGTFTVKLYQGKNLIATQNFGWVRSGVDLLPANTTALNAWVHSYPQADGYEYAGTVAVDAGARQSAAIYTKQIYNGAVTQSTTNAIARPQAGGGRIVFQIP